ncbi:unnamed protein product, partial [Mesorhabditis spiculigera]
MVPTLYIVICLLFIPATSKASDTLLTRLRRQSTICNPDPKNPPETMPQCFCCVCAGISPFCQAPVTRTTPRTTFKTTIKTTSKVTTRATTRVSTLKTTLRPVPCVDVNNNCPSWVSNGFCTNTAYSIQQRQQYCARSCNLCGAPLALASSTKTPCADTNTNCSTWIKNGFCTSTSYTLAQRQSYCGKSCKLC